MLKRGLSQVIVILLVTFIGISLLSILAVVLLPQFSESGEGTSTAVKCLSISISPVACEWYDDGLLVQVARGADEERLSDIQFIFTGTDSTTSLNRHDASVAPYPSQFERENFYFSNEVLDLLDSPPQKVTITPVLLSSRNRLEFCPLTQQPIPCIRRLNEDLPPRSDERSEEDSGWASSPGGGGSSGGGPPGGGPSGGSTGQPECSDGLDNDGDSWSDSQDADCVNSNSREAWVALSECSDGIDQDRDGLIDKADPGCTSALDMNEHNSLGQCSDELDNDNDGLYDYPLDPGCTSPSDSETGETRDATSHAFKFTFGAITAFSGNFLEDVGALMELNWTDSFGTVNRLLLDENSLQADGSGIRYFPHSALNNQGGTPGWSYTLNGARVQASHSIFEGRTLSYIYRAREADHVAIKVTDGTLEVIDHFRFVGDTMYLTLEVTNRGTSKLTNISLPLYLGSLTFGTRELGSYSGGDPNSGITQLIPRDGGVSLGLIDNNQAPTTYPDIDTYSPVQSLWDARKTLSGQVLTKLYEPETVVFNQILASQHRPIQNYLFTILGLNPGEARVITLAFTASSSGDWQTGLEPYKQWFSYQYGTTPTYCPELGFNWLLGSNSGGNFFTNQTQRYLPGTSLVSLFKPADSALQSRFYGFETMGVWGTALYSGHLILDGSSLEFNPNIDLIDPNLDAGPNRAIIDSLVGGYQYTGVRVIWFARPCATIYNANIIYNSDGTTTFVRGTPSSYSDVDLRNVTNRDRYFARLNLLAGHGVRGFYYDAVGCPGDEAFFNYAETKLKQQYGPNFFFVREGALDRSTIRWGSIPINPGNSYSIDSSWKLYSYLTPQATYFAGNFNSPISVDRYDHFSSQGVQLIPLQYPPTSTNLNEPFDVNGNRAPLSQHLCSWMNQNYQNRYLKWQTYGSSLGCSQPPTSPPCAQPMNAFI